MHRFSMTYCSGEAGIAFASTLSNSFSWSTNANAMAVYTFLRVVADHVDPNLVNLKMKEVAFISYVLTHKVGLLML